MSSRGGLLSELYPPHLQSALKAEYFTAVFFFSLSWGPIYKAAAVHLCPLNLVAHSRHLARLPKLPTSLQNSVRRKPRTSSSSTLEHVR